MFKKLITVLCHPSRVGIYFLDRWYTILGYIMLFLALAISFVSIKDLNTKVFDRTTTNAIASKIYSSSQIDALEFSDNKLNNINRKLEIKDCVVYFNDSGEMNSLINMNMTIVFGTTKASIYYGISKLGFVEYSNLKVSDFKISDAKNGNISARLEFFDLVDSILYSGETEYRLLILGTDIINLVMYYFISLVVCLFTAFIANQTIQGKIRLKLIAYDSISYLLVFIFATLFSLSWLVYAGFIFPIIYTILTFTHIKKITVKRSV